VTIRLGRKRKEGSKRNTESIADVLAGKALSLEQIQLQVEKDRSLGKWEKSEFGLGLVWGLNLPPFYEIRRHGVSRLQRKKN